MSPEQTDHEPVAPVTPASQPTADPATAALAEFIAAGLKSGAIRPRIERTLPDGSIEVQPFTVTPEKGRLAVFRAVAHAAELQAARDLRLGGQASDDESQADKKGV